MDSVVRRSCLSVPAPDAAKVLTPGADEIVIDLEDFVTPDAKPRARADLAARLLAIPPTPATIAARVNAVGTRWCHEDVLHLVGNGAGLASLVTPKVKHPDDIAFVDRLPTGVEAGGAGLRIGIQALIETAKGMHRVDETAATSPRLRTLILGYADLGAVLGRPYEPRTLAVWLPAQHAVLLAARRRGLHAIDGPYLAFNDAEGSAAVNQRARDLGFDDKWGIHPRQIGPVNEAFTPSDEKAERARSVCAALERTERDGSGAIAVNGEMADSAMALTARQTLSRAGTGGVR
ncbi:HpcH/HpaI aldolase/citrate lyase family protein [Streptosporangium amethystogenes]|uniref:HpcH/HpaI aldolase/citrate lyase family protein n=1 Tax=Streptosporangium amethystogenes TaxID=2002 RepID=UPI0004CA116C|nr:CoA ester lyase [Streptosporangium amethystogenes]